MALDSCSLSPLSDDDHSFRAITRRRDLDENEFPILSAFLRRKRKDPAGLSVYHHISGPNDVPLDDIKVLSALHSGKVRGLGLDVVPDGPNHANIVGLHHQDDDYQGAMDQASELREICKNAWTKSEDFLLPEIFSSVK